MIIANAMYIVNMPKLLLFSNLWIMEKSKHDKL
jgi:hypothetical protein